MTHLPSQHALHHRDVHARFVLSELESVFDESGPQAALLVPENDGAITATFVDQPVFLSESGITTVASPLAPTALSVSSVLASTSSGVSQVIPTTSSSSVSIYASSSLSSSSSVLTASTSSSTPLSTMAISSSRVDSSNTPPPTSMPESTDVSTTTLSSSTSTLPGSPASANTPSSTSNLISHTPPFYVGIVLGTIVVIACVAAFIAWWFRLRTHTRRSRRRKGSGVIDVPWARSRPVSALSFHSGDDPEKGLESGLGLELEHYVPGQHAWEPRGDRDAGEPKRTRSFMESLKSPVKSRMVPLLPSPPPPPAAYPFLQGQGHLTPVSLINHPRYADPTMSLAAAGAISPVAMAPLPLGSGTLRDSVAYPLSASTSRQSIPPLPRPGHPVSAGYQNPSLDYNLAEVQGVRLQFPNDPEFGTPRESVVRPRFLNLLGSARGIGINSCGGFVSGGWKRLEEEGKGDKVEELEVQSLSMTRYKTETETKAIETGKTLTPQVEEKESWTSSIKANFMSAFNAVAKAAGGTGSLRLDDAGEDDDKLTALPVSFENRRRGRGRREEGMRKARAGLRSTGWVEYFGGELVGWNVAVESEAEKEGEEEEEEEEVMQDEGHDVVHPRKSSLPMLPSPFSKSQSGANEGLGLGLQLDFERVGLIESEGAIGSMGSATPLIVRKKNSVSSSGSNSSRRPSNVRRGSSSESESVSRRSTMRSLRSMRSCRSVMTVLDEREEAARRALVKRMQGRREASEAGERRDDSEERESIPGWV